TTEPAMSGIGWSQGIACHVSLPSMLALRAGRNGWTAVSFLRPRARRNLLGRHRPKQVWIDCAIAQRGYVAALPGKRDVAGAVQRRPRLPCRRDPLREGVRRHGA